LVVPYASTAIVTLTSESTEPLINDALLTCRLAGVFTEWLGAERVKEVPAITAAEDFTFYGRTPDRVPTFFWLVGGTAPEKFEESKRTGIPVPSNHNSGFVPAPEPTLKTAITSMSAAVLDLLGKR
jgi:hippurate hydrolase